MQKAARSASFAATLSELEFELRHLFMQDGGLTEEERRVLERMTELYAEGEALDVIRIGAMGVLEQGEPSGRFPRRLNEVIRDLTALKEKIEAGATA